MSIFIEHKNHSKTLYYSRMHWIWTALRPSRVEMSQSVLRFTQFCRISCEICTTSACWAKAMRAGAFRWDVSSNEPLTDTNRCQHANTQQCRLAHIPNVLRLPNVCIVARSKVMPPTRWESCVFNTNLVVEVGLAVNLYPKPEIFYNKNMSIEFKCFFSDVCMTLLKVYL